MNNKNVRFVAEIGIFSAIGLILDFIAGLYSSFIWTMGGSISIAMIAIFIMSFRWGLKGGLLTGLVVGTIQILWAGKAAVYPVQIILDYILAYTVVGFSGLYAKKINSVAHENKLYYIIIAISISGALRTIVHIISGYLFFSEYAPSEVPALPWSIVYNMGYMIPSIILCIIITIQIQKRASYLIDKFE